MIVVDTSIFIDLIIEYDKNRTKLAKNLFNWVQEHKKLLYSPDLFKIEFIGQLVRRMNKQEAFKIAEEYFTQINFVSSSDLFEMAFTIAYETGARASDAFFIAVAKMKDVN